MTLTGTGELKWKPSPYIDWPDSFDLYIGGSFTSLNWYNLRNGFENHLDHVTIAAPIERIGDRAFTNSTLTSIDLPGTLKSIGSHAFNSCKKLGIVSIPGTVNTIGDHAFYTCTGLKSLTINEGVTTIGSYAFAGCTTLPGAVIPSTVKEIKDSAFINDSSMTTLTISEGVTTIGASAFAGCSSLEEVRIPASVTSIGASAFKNCVSLRTVTFVKGDGTDTLTIGANAFQGCISLGEVALPGSIKSVGASAFQDCTGILTVTVEHGNMTIGKNAFQGCTGLTNLDLLSDEETPAGIAIGSGAFQGCTALEQVNIPRSVSSLDSSTFQGCVSLRSATLEEGIASLPSSFFNGCTNLEEVYLPSTLTSLIYNAFTNCSSLTDIYYAGTWTQWYGRFKSAKENSSNTYYKNAVLHVKMDDFFVVGRDTNGFLNDEDASYRVSGETRKEYHLNSSLYDRLVSNLSVAQKTRFDNNAMKSYCGICEGISISMIYARTDVISPSQFDASAQNYTALKAPRSYVRAGAAGSTFRDIITYYQLLQNVDKIKPAKILYYMRANTLLNKGATWDAFWSSFFAEVRTGCAQETPVVLDFGYKKSGQQKGSHSVVACGIDESNPDYTVVQIYDCNSQGSNPPILPLYYLIVEKNSQTFYLSKNWQDPASNLLNEYFMQSGKWDYFLYYSIASLSRLDTGLDTVVPLDGASGAAEFDVEGGVPFTLTNARGQTLAFDGETYSGDMTVSDMRPITGDTYTMRYTLPASDSLTLSGMEDGASYDVIVGKNYYAAQVSGAESVTFTADKGIEIAGSNYDFRTAMSTGDGGVLRIAGHSEGDSSLTYNSETDGAVDLSAEDGLSGVTVESLTEDGLSGYDIPGSFTENTVTPEGVLGQEEPGLPGDMNGDELVDRRDRISLSRALAGWDGCALTPAADVDRDGSATLRDRAVLARQLAGWEDIPA